MTDSMYALKLLLLLIKLLLSPNVSFISFMLGLALYFSIALLTKYLLSEVTLQKFCDFNTNLFN